MGGRWRALAGVLVLAWGVAARDAAAATAHLVTDAAFGGHLPGPDLRIGTEDDLVAFVGVGPNGSGPNDHMAASFALLDQDGALGSSAETNGYDYVLFVDGTIEFTPDLSATTATDVVLQITGGALRSTAEFGWPGRTDSDTTLTGGTAHLNPITGEASVTLSGTFGGAGTPFPLAGETLAAAPGKARVVLGPYIGTTGDVYLDLVVAPAVPDAATALLVVEFTGTVQSAACCTGFATRGVLIAYTTDTLGACDVVPSLCEPGPGPGGGGGCDTAAACHAGLAATLPDPDAAADARARKVANKVSALAAKAWAAFDLAETSSGRRQTRQYARARKALRKLVALARSADAKGRLGGASLAAIETAVDAFLALAP